MNLPTGPVMSGPGSEGNGRTVIARGHRGMTIRTGVVRRAQSMSGSGRKECGRVLNVRRKPVPPATAAVTAPPAGWNVAPGINGATVKPELAAGPQTDCGVVSDECCDVGVLLGERGVEGSDTASATAGQVGEPGVGDLAVADDAGGVDF